MKKLVWCAILLFLSSSGVGAQQPDLLVLSNDKGLYLEHKVVPKESFYSVGRQYNVSPKFIASFNNLDLNKGLLIDQKIRIPLTDTNFTQKDEGGTAVYYKVKSKDNLTKISAANKDVSISKLRSWNKLIGDKIIDGTKLIVGFLISNETISAKINHKPVQPAPVIKSEEKPVEKAEENPVITTVPIAVAKKEENPVITTAPKAVVKKEERPVSAEQGYFKSSFDQQVKINPAVKNETVTSGIFRTISGWQDAKYYLLMDAVLPGTIVKVINPDNNKAVYAKVLGEMSGIRQNAGFNIRISNAAAAVLEIREQDKFIVKINY